MMKSREFDNVLDECLERLLTKGETIERCLQSFPKHADELKPLLETALATRQAAAIQPRLEFRNKAKYQFYAALQEMQSKRSRLFFSWQPRWAVAVAIVLVLLLAGSSTVAAASTSMPDGLLYPVKLATEQVQLVLAPSALAKAELYTRLADKRVLEIARMATENKPEQIEQITRRLDTYLTKIADLSSTQALKDSLTGAAAVEEAPSPVARANEGKKEQVKSDRRAQLRATVAHNATDNSARLRALLKTAPESAKPALQRAIDTLDSGYEKAIKSLD